MPGSYLFWRTTIAMAFQRMRLLMRRSMARSPGYGTSSSGRMVFTYGVLRWMGRSDARAARLLGEALQQKCGAVRPLLVQYLIQRLDPFGGFARVQVNNTFSEFLVHEVIFIIVNAGAPRSQAATFRARRGTWKAPSCGLKACKPGARRSDLWYPAF